MKKIFLPVLLSVLSILFIGETNTYAQALGDTLLIYANPEGATIDAQITADQANNPPADRVYLLQQAGATDTVYFYNANINTALNLTIVGKPNPVTGMLPIIAPGFTAAGSSPAFFIGVTSTGVTLNLKNLYISNKNINGVATTTGQGPVKSSADSVTFLVDHCVFDGIAKIHYIYPNASYNKVKITNSEFRGQQNPSIGGGFLYYGLGLPTDTLIIKNCTLFCMNGRIFGETGYSPYFEFDHNTVFFDACLTGWGAVEAPWMNAVIKNNIFYGSNVLGQDTSVYIRQTYDGSYQGNQVIGMDSLNATVSSLGYTEAERHLTVENNAYFWPKDYVDFMQTLKSDTGSTIVPPVWMNNFVQHMFADKTSWPYLVSQNNVNVDPGFNSAVVSQVIDSLKPFIADYWKGGTSAHNWGLYLYSNPLEIYTMQGHVVKNDWASIQGYPVPENLKYTNTALYNAGTDGLPLGDPNWFPNITDVKQIPNAIPSKFDLSQNYPNPFNPTTIINYQIPKAGFVTLKIYNILGQEVAILYSGFQKAGAYKADFDATKLASGVYMYQLQSDGFTLTKKMLLLK